MAEKGTHHPEEENRRFRELLHERLDFILRQTADGRGFWGMAGLEIMVEDGVVRRFVENIRRSHK